MKKCAALLLVGLIHALLSQVALAQQEKTALVPLPEDLMRPSSSSAMAALTRAQGESTFASVRLL